MFAHAPTNQSLVPLLANLSEQQLFHLARCMESAEVAADTRVFSQGDPGDAFYVVNEGAFLITGGWCRWVG